MLTEDKITTFVDAHRHFLHNANNNAFVPYDCEERIRVNNIIFKGAGFNFERGAYTLVEYGARDAVVSVKLVEKWYEEREAQRKADIAELKAQATEVNSKAS